MSTGLISALCLNDCLAICWKTLHMIDNLFFNVEMHII